MTPQHTEPRCAADIVEAIEGYLHRGERMFPVELAEAAVELLKARCVPSRTLLPLQAWLSNSDPRLSHALLYAVLVEFRGMVKMEES